jgi:hypothetical protein
VQLSAVVLLVGSTLAVSSGAAVGAAEAGRGDPLFAADDVLPIRITGPFQALAKDRAPEPEYRPGTLSYGVEPGAAPAFSVGLRPRGNSRRDRQVCKVPPLRLNLRSQEVEGTLFDGQDKLKLVTHCQSSSRHDRFVYKEYLVYRMLNQVSDASFRVRGLDIEYVDSGNPGKVARRFGFFIEDKERLAHRLGLQAAEPVSIDARRLEPHHTSLMDLFQFMIGNTDFAFTAGPEGDHCCHNATLLTAADGLYRPMPYDFDVSGFVNPPYALVDERLPIRDVRKRLYRGLCWDSNIQEQALERVRQARSAIVGVLQQETPLDESSRRVALAYIDAFYAVLDDPDDLQRRVLGACRQPG